MADRPTLALVGTWLALATAHAAEPPAAAAVPIAVQAARLPSLEEARDTLPTIVLVTSLPLRIVRTGEAVAVQTGPLADASDAEHLLDQLKSRGFTSAAVVSPASDTETLLLTHQAMAAPTVAHRVSRPQNGIVTRGAEPAIFPYQPADLTSSDSLDKAWKALKRRDLERAAELFRAFAKQSGSHAREASWGLAIVHYRREEYGEAAALLEQLLDKGYRPEDVRPLYVDALRRLQAGVEADAQSRCRRLFGDGSLSFSACRQPWLQSAAELIKH